jgi:hypothetical protein
MTFELWRQDDNGNRFLVDLFNELSAAEKRFTEMPRCHHKQTYWIKERADVQ